MVPMTPNKKVKLDGSRQSGACVTSCTAAQPSTVKSAPRVRIKVKAPTQHRETVFLTGGAPELGEWDVDRGIALQWAPGHIWHGQIELRSPHTEIKFVRKHEHQATANCQSGANICKKRRKSRLLSTFLFFFSSFSSFPLPHAAPLPPSLFFPSPPILSLCVPHIVVSGSAGAMREWARFLLQPG